MAGGGVFPAFPAAQFVYYLDFITHISLWTQYRIAILKLDVQRLWKDGDDFNAPPQGAPIASGI